MFYNFYKTRERSHQKMQRKDKYEINNIDNVSKKHVTRKQRKKLMQKEKGMRPKEELNTKHM